MLLRAHYKPAAILALVPIDKIVLPDQKRPATVVAQTALTA